MSQIAGINALVTGGGSGIGRQMALELARRGANVVLWDIDKRSLDRVTRELRTLGVEAHGYVCDVSDRAKVYETAERVKAEVGPIGVLINNAGVVSGQPLLELADEKIERTFKVNVLGLFWVTKAFLPEMIERDAGHVVTIASASGMLGVARLSDYSASKHAAIGFDESLRMELRQLSPGVHTTVVCPYYINTGMFEGAKSRFPFLLPFLEETDVATRVIDAVAHDRARVIMPPLVFTVPVMRVFPTAVFDFVADFLGINASMDDFVGRAKETVRRRGKAKRPPAAPKLEVV